MAGAGLSVGSRTVGGLVGTGVGGESLATCVDVGAGEGTSGTHATKTNIRIRTSLFIYICKYQLNNPLILADVTFLD
jgi:hypothetical protein